MVAASAYSTLTVTVIGRGPAAIFETPKYFELALHATELAPCAPVEIRRRHQEVQGQADVLVVIPGENHLRHAAFEIALADMAGDADQDVLLRALRQRDAVAGLRARLKTPENISIGDEFEHDGAAAVGGMRLAAALIGDDEERRSRDEFAVVALLGEFDVASPGAGIGI